MVWSNRTPSRGLYGARAENAAGVYRVAVSLSLLLGEAHADLRRPGAAAAARVRAQVLSVTPPGGGGGPALKSITSPSNGRLVSSQGPRLGRAPPKAAGGGGGARRKRSKSASAGTSKAGDEDGLTVETDSASDGDPASSDRDSTTMTGSPISSLRKESAKRSK